MTGWGGVMRMPVLMAVLAAVLLAATAVTAVMAMMKTRFLSKTPPQFPAANHPALDPAMMALSMRYVSHWRRGMGGRACGNVG